MKRTTQQTRPILVDTSAYVTQHGYTPTTDERSTWTFQCGADRYTVTAAYGAALARARFTAFSNKSYVVTLMA